MDVDYAIMSLPSPCIQTKQLFFSRVKFNGRVHVPRMLMLKYIAQYVHLAKQSLPRELELTSYYGLCS